MILHIALAQFKPSTDPALIKKFFEDIGGLRHDVPGIVNYSWGVNDSPEGLSQGFTHALTMTFRDAQVREAYLNHPKHLALKQAALPHVGNIVVVDYPV